MHELFNSQNWADFLGDASLWNAAAILLLASSALFATLYSDSIQQWRTQRQERDKWLHWNR